MVVPAHTLYCMCMFVCAVISLISSFVNGKFIIVSAVPFLIGPSRCPIGLEHEASVESVATSSSPGAEEEEEKEGEVSTKKPAMVVLPEDMTAMQIDCGTFHTGRALLLRLCCYNI